MANVTFEVEKFDGKGNFEIWRLRVKPLLDSQGYQEALQGKDRKPESMSDGDWEELDLKARCTIRLMLTDEVLLLVFGEKTAAGLWAKLETLFLDKSPDRNSQRRKASSQRMTLGHSNTSQTVIFGTEGVSFGIEKFDGKRNFAIWRSRIKDLLVLQGRHNALLGKDSKPESMSDNEWKKMDRKLLATVRLLLADAALIMVMRAETTVELWTKLESFYLNKTAMNRIFLKRKLYSLRMKEGTRILDQLITFNDIIFQLESIGVVIEEENKVVMLLAMLPESFDGFVVLWGLNLDTSFDSVCKSLLDYELQNKVYRVRSENSKTETCSSRGRSAERAESTRSKSKPKGRSFNGACWLCGESGHIKKNCWKKKL